MNSRCKRRLKSTNTEQSSAELARRYALRLLSGRDYSVAKLKLKLRARSFTEADVEEAVSGLEKENWISDRRFAERFAESALASGRFYGIRLRMEMLRRGIRKTLRQRWLILSLKAATKMMRQVWRWRGIFPIFRLRRPVTRISAEYSVFCGAAVSMLPPLCGSCGRKYCN